MIKVECFLCRQSFHFGPHRYDGRRIPEWNTMVCDTCHKANWDGIGPDTHPHVEPYLRTLGIEVRRNAKGWIDFPAR
jgi:hypothetical protein